MYFLKLCERILVILFHTLCIYAFALWWRIILIKTSGIKSSAPARDNRTFDALPVESIPINARKEFMILDALCTTGYIAQPLAWIDSTYGHNKISGGLRGKQYLLGFLAGVCGLCLFRSDRFRKHNFAHDDLGVDLHGVLIEEWRLSEQEFVEQDPKRPPERC